MKIRRKKRGTSLIELLVYTFLAAIVTSCVFGVLVASMKYYRIAEANATVQQNAMYVITNLSQEIAETKGSSVICVTTGGYVPGIVFPSPKKMANSTSTDPIYAFSTNGNLLWKKWVCYYLDLSLDSTTNKARAQIVKKEIAIGTPAEAPGTAPWGGSPYTWSLASSIQKDIVANNIHSFTTSKVTGTTDMFEIRVTARQNVGSSTDKFNEIQVQTRIQAKNNGI